MMTPNKYKKLVGYTLIVGGISFFYPFFNISAWAPLGNPNILEIVFSALHAFIFYGLWLFHIPGFVLIILGIWVLRSK